MDFKEIYNLIGFAGVALVIIGVFALYITVWNFLYLRGVLSRFKKHFHGMDKATPERIRRYFGCFSASRLAGYGCRYGGGFPHYL